MSPLQKNLAQRMLLATLPFLLTAPYGVAQMPQPPTAAEAQAALNPAPAPFTNAQLDQLLAPIALYPDQLLTQVLMASTFPDQLVDAEKWLQDGNNAALKGDDLANALQPLPWDPSVKSLVAFPQLVAMMVNHLDWTQALGAAFANQQVEVFARVQFLRDRAKQAGTLNSTSQIAVREADSDIIIEPAEPNMMYVPVYNPAEVYGAWPDNDAPPVYIPPPPGFYEGALGAGIGFSVGFGIVAPLWGWGHPDWRRHEIVVDQSRYQRITAAPVIVQNHITIENGAWHRTAPVNFVPEAQRPHPAPSNGPQPAGTIRPNEAPHPAQPGPGNGGSQPRPGGPQPARSGEVPAQPGRPSEPQPVPHPPEAQPAPHPPEVHPEPGPNGEHPAPPHLPEVLHGTEPPHPPAPPNHPAPQPQAQPQPHPAPPQPHPAPPQAHPAPQAQQPHPQGGGNKPAPRPGEEERR